MKNLQRGLLLAGALAIILFGYHASTAKAEETVECTTLTASWFTIENSMTNCSDGSGTHYVRSLLTGCYTVSTWDSNGAVFETFGCPE